MDTIIPTNGHDQCLDKWIEKKTSLFLFSFYRKIELQWKKNPLHKQQTNIWISGKYCIIFFCTMFVMAIRHLTASSRQLCIEVFSHCLRLYGFLNYCMCNVSKTKQLKKNVRENSWCHQKLNRKKCVYFDNDPYNLNRGQHR